MGAGGLTVYRGCTPVVDDRYDVASDKSPSDVIIEALAEATDVEAMDLPPLYDYIDPEALNSMFVEDYRADDTEALLSFTVETWNVFVRADGRVRICDATRPTDPTPVFESTTA